MSGSLSNLITSGIDGLWEPTRSVHNLRLWVSRLTVELRRRLESDLQSCQFRETVDFRRERRGQYETSGQGCPESELVLALRCRLPRTSQLSRQMFERPPSRNTRIARSYFVSRLRRVFGELVKKRIAAFLGGQDACPSECPTPLQTDIVVQLGLRDQVGEIVISGEARVYSFCVAFGDPRNPPQEPPQPGTEWAEGGRGDEPTAGAIILTDEPPECPGKGKLSICSYVAAGQIPNEYPTEGDWKTDTTSYALSSSFAVMGDKRLRDKFCQDDDCVAAFKKVKGSDECVQNAEKRATRCCTEYEWECKPSSPSYSLAPPGTRVYHPSRRRPPQWAPEDAIQEVLSRSTDTPVPPLQGVAADAYVPSS